MTAKLSRIVNIETVLCLAALICRSVATPRPTQVETETNRRHHGDDLTSTFDLKRRNSATRVLLRCQAKCQVELCRSLCDRRSSEGRSNSEERSRRRRYVAVDGSRDFRPSSASTTYLLASSTFALEDSSSGSGGTVQSTFNDSISSELSSGSPIDPTTSASVRHVTRSRPSVVNVSVKVEVKNGELSVNLKFFWPSRENWVNHTVKVHWASESCNFDPKFPHSEESNHHHDISILANANKWNQRRINGPFLFNAKYWIKIEKERESSASFYFTTPGCYQIDQSKKKKCLILDPAKREDPDRDLLINVSCIVYDGTSDIMTADVRWPTGGLPTAANSSWESSIVVLRMPHRSIEHTRKMNGLEMTIELKVGFVYEILISTNNKRHEIVYEPLFINTSKENLKPNGQFKHCPATPDVYPQTILLGILGFITVDIAALVFYMYWKRKGVTWGGWSKKKKPPSCEPLNPNGDEWEINPEEVTLKVEIGQGAFGRVFTGYYRDKEVAIKLLKENIPEFYREDLLREIFLMKGLGFHPHIVTMLGACTIREPTALIVEYMPFGNLLSFLKKCRVDREFEVPEKRDELQYCLIDEMTGTKESWQITANDILSFARQVVLAMQYLADHHYVHRDLAARNVLLGQNKVVKVCDFGLARFCYSGDQYFKLTGGRLPLKWMALESIRDRVFTTFSDVWSFGVLLWEMVTLGASPYPGVALVDLYRLLSEGYRMQQPANCSDELYDIISQCWCENPADRPTFARVRSQVEELLSKNVDYLDLDNIDICLDHSEKEENSGTRDRLLPTNDTVCIF